MGSRGEVAGNELERAALNYSRRGWPVLPLHEITPRGCSCGDRGCGSPAKHPRTQHGLDDATTDEATIRSWWRRWPRANIGLRTGERFDVVDIDQQSQALRSLHRAAGGTFAWVGPRVQTSRGWHLYVAPTGAGTHNQALPGLDWKGKGGYVVAPPSLHPSGYRYRWDGLHREAPIPQAPQWLLDAVKPPTTLRTAWTGNTQAAAPKPEDKPATKPADKPAAYWSKALKGEVDNVLRAREGTRNDALNRAAFKLGRAVGAGMLEEDKVTAELFAAGVQVGLGELETRRTIHSGLSKGITRPRSISAGLA